jgi:hypothetical protein
MAGQVKGGWTSFAPGNLLLSVDFEDWTFIYEAFSELVISLIFLLVVVGINRE